MTFVSSYEMLPPLYSSIDPYIHVRKGRLAGILLPKSPRCGWPCLYRDCGNRNVVIIVSKSTRLGASRTATSGSAVTSSDVCNGYKY